jgi:transposase
VLLDKMLSVFKEHGWLKAGQRQRTDATHVVAATRTLSRIEMVGETLRQALNVLATVLPDWLEEQVSPEWYDRYGRAFESYRMPKTEAELLALAEQIGRDGWHLLVPLSKPTAWPWVRQLPALVTLAAVWEQQYGCEDDTVHWRSKEALPESADLICTPYDPQARYSRKRETTWIGYKVHLTETCEAAAPHLITHVETTPATQPDSTVVDTIHTDLEQRQILPGEHLADTAYVSSANLVNSQTQHVDLVGPVNLDNSWQAQADQGFDASQFHIDWETQQVQCPNGQTNDRWFDHQDRHGNPVIQVRFPRQTCLTCPLRSHCTTSPQAPRILTLQPQAQHVALQQARQRQITETFKTTYRVCAGIEGTLSQAVQVSDLRYTRYRGLIKTHFQHLATAAALNLTRIFAWLMEIPFAKTRTSHFAALAP